MLLLPDDSRFDEPPFGEPLRAVIGHLLLGSEPLMRKRVAGTLLAIAVYVVCCMLAFFGAAHGLAREGFGERMLLITVLPQIAFYALVRSGWTTHLPDPGLILAQMLFALGAITFAYAMVTPHERGAVLMVIAVLVVFGTYSLTPRQAVGFGLAVAGVLGSTIAVMTHLDPSYYPWHYELIRFELLAGTLPALTVTSRFIAHWRVRLVQQKRELKAALERVQQLATRDTLTGLINRRHMQELLEQEWQRQQRLGVPFTVALIDLDHFKRINDQHGHRVGDDVLRHFAHTAGAALRNTDVIARWGGEEFLILFQDASPAHAHACLQRLTETLSTLSVSTQIPELRVHFSAGVAQHRLGRSLDYTLERADRALYMAKAAGRNRSQIARDSTTPASLGH